MAMDVHTHTCTHVALVISCLGLCHSSSAPTLLAGSTSIRHTSEMQAGEKIFQFFLIWQKSIISNQQKYITSDGVHSIILLMR